MLRFSRSEVTPPENKSRIVDGQGAKAWLAGMPLPISVENLAEITQVLHALGAQGAQETAQSLEPQRKFAIADRIRGVLLPLLSERAHEDGFTVLPLPDDFSLRFWAIVDTIAALRDVYAWLVSQLPEASLTVDTIDPAATDLSAASGSSVSGVGALHRALDVSAHMMLCIQRARWAVPLQLWERHCVLGQLVRDLDCQDVEVADALRISVSKTCRAAFVLPLMIALSDPASRNSAEFEVSRMAAQRWSTKVGFRLERRNDVGDAPLRPVANPGPTLNLGGFVLRFDTQSALQSIDKRLEALAEGRSPREVGIGDSLRSQAARELLLSLKQRWGAKAPADIDSPDRAWRVSPGGVQVLAMVGMPSSEAQLRNSVLGANIDARGQQNAYSYQRMKHGGITQPREQIDRSRIEQLLEGAETWTLAAESADAVRCIRKQPRPRIGLQRLVGLKLGTIEEDAPFLLGWVEALQGTTVTLDDQQIRYSGAHRVRVRLAPGIPQVLQASIDDIEVERAFLLVPGGDAEARARAGKAVAFVPMLSDSRLKKNPLLEDDDGWKAVRASPREYGLVLPHASFRPQRLVKAVRLGGLAMLRLEELMMRGSDFDLVRFTPL
jgi:hypothetical protein